MTTFERRLQVPVPRQELHDWHVRKGAFERLCAPWEDIRHVHADPLEDGAKRVFDVKKGGVWMRWVADHRDVVPPERFTDVQERGPFKHWAHTHRFEPRGEHASELVDHIDYALPLGRLGAAIAGGSIRSDVERMFSYRHDVTRGDLAQHALYLDRPKLRIAVTGASGMIGTQLVAFLRTGGHEVVRLVRRDDEPAADEIRWSADRGVVDLDRLEGIDAVVHLAGASVDQRWTDEGKRRIMGSRVDGTRAIIDAISRLAAPPRTFVSASAVGFYGDTGDAIVDETGATGEGFLAEVCRAWERESSRASELGCRTTQLRIGVVLDPRGGALAKMLPVFKAGLGGRLGSGEQLVSWVALDDVLGAVLTALQNDDLAGPVNVTGPQPVTQADLAKTLGDVLSRPAIAPAPAAAIKLLYGEMGEETALGSVGARPGRLIEHGYRFRLPTLGAALRHALGKS